MIIREKNKKVKKITLIPEVKIITDQLNKTKRVCPMSGWRDNNKATPRVIRKENEYL